MGDYTINDAGNTDPKDLPYQSRSPPPTPESDSDEPDARCNTLRSMVEFTLMVFRQNSWEWSANTPDEPRWVYAIYDRGGHRVVGTVLHAARCTFAEDHLETYKAWAPDKRARYIAEVEAGVLPSRLLLDGSVAKRARCA